LQATVTTTCHYVRLLGMQGQIVIATGTRLGSQAPPQAAFIGLLQGWNSPTNKVR